MAEPTYCTTCNPKRPEPHVGPGVPVSLGGGTIHRANCPLIPHLSAEASQRIYEAAEESRRCRNRAMAFAHTYVIGGI
jgi:hypothetical protein